MEQLPLQMLQEDVALSSLLEKQLELQEEQLPLQVLQEDVALFSLLAKQLELQEE